MANEGLDKKTLSAVVFATPKGRIEQAVGRVQRPCAEKPQPIVVDIADAAAMVGQRWKRQRWYQKMRYELQVLDAMDAGEEGWFV